MSASTIRNDSECDVIRFHQAVKLQLRLLWLSRRPLVLLAAMVTVGLMVRGLLFLTTFGLVQVAILAYLAGAIWAFAVWSGEPPAGRDYMWSQPVNRTHQTLARVLAGLVWLWAMLAVMLAIGVVIATFDGYLDGLPTISSAEWLYLFVSPTIGYLMLSCLTVVFAHPFWWMLGLNLLRFSADLAGLFDGVGDFGLSQVLLGPGELGSYWWIVWPPWVIALALLLWALAHAHPDRLARWPSRILSKSSGVTAITLST